MPDERWHIVWIDEAPGGWAARCLPHGLIGTGPSHLAAFTLAYAHDFEITGDLNMSVSVTEGG